ncbi:MAG: hypothetical protein ICV84_11485 [Flavisolibacter sp.]|nr:hypothetical protein [Flavisolibacter sp.]
MIYPFAMLFILLTLIAAMIGFIVIKRWGRQEATLPASRKETLYKDNGWVIFKEPINYGVDELAENFQFSVVEYSDEMDVYKLCSIPPVAGIHDTYVTGLLVEFENEIILQRIVNENEGASSELIGINKTTKAVVTYQKIGLFNLFRFDDVTNEIIGANKAGTVRVKLK